MWIRLGAVGRLGTLLGFRLAGHLSLQSAAPIGPRNRAGTPSAYADSVRRGAGREGGERRGFPPMRGGSCGWQAFSMHASRHRWGVRALVVVALAAGVGCASPMQATPNPTPATPNGWANRVYHTTHARCQVNRDVIWTLGAHHYVCNYDGRDHVWVSDGQGHGHWEWQTTPTESCMVIHTQRHSASDETGGTVRPCQDPFGGLL